MRQKGNNPRVKKTSKSSGRARQVSNRAAIATGLRRPQSAAEAALEEFADEVRAGMQQRKVDVWPVWDNRDAYAKRKIYSWVLEHIRNKTDVNCTKRAFPRDNIQKPNFEQNRFHWAIAACQDCGVPIDQAYTSRYARQMLYAYGHGIEPELLIGFIYQCGGYETMNRKLNDNIHEDWYTADYRKKKEERRYQKSNW